MGLYDFGVEAANYPWDGQPVAWTSTCDDGSYRLRVPPRAQGYVVRSALWWDNGYVPVAWDGTSDGTFFPCEGGAVSASIAGGTTADVDLPLPSGAGAISGNVRTQDSGCSSLDSGQQWVQVDDGSAVQCNLGQFDWEAPPGTFRVYGLPHSGLISSLRVCNYSVPSTSPQCYTMKQPPSYTPVAVPSGGEVTNVDFCMGNRPETQIATIQVQKSGSSIMFSWDASTDPYHDRYRVYGATTPVPAIGSGSFPADPVFNQVSDDYANSAWIDESSVYSFFLVTDVGVTGAEGPSGSYGN